MFRHGDPGGRIYGAAGTAGVNILSHWTSSPSITAWSVLAANGRTTGSCLRVSPQSNTQLSKTLNAQATWGIAFGFRVSLFQSSISMEICGVQDIGSAQVDLRINGDGTLSVTRNATILGTTSFSLSLNNWYHIEFKVTIHPSAGTAQVWINGTSRLSLTSQNTRATANSTANVVHIGSITNRNTVTNWDYDDIIIYDSQTNDVNGLADITGPIGDCALSWIVPSGTGTTTQFTPDSGSNYARVNEATVDTTSYVESSTANQIDTYAMGDLSGTAVAVKSLAVVHYARKTDAGSRGMKAQIRSGGTDYTHAVESALSDSYLYYMSPWGQNPNTSATWTVSDVNALEAGQKVSS